MLFLISMMFHNTCLLVEDNSPLAESIPLGKSTLALLSCNERRLSVEDLLRLMNSALLILPSKPKKCISKKNLKPLQLPFGSLM
jgi:hypothetical protein